MAKFINTFFIICSLCIMWFGVCAAQTSHPEININGDCNGPTVSSEASTTIINCYFGIDRPTGSVKNSYKIVIDARGTTIHTWQQNQFGNIFWTNGPPYQYSLNNSKFTLKLGEETYRNDFIDQFDFGNHDLESGRHSYSMRVRIVYYNNFTTEANCSGLIDVESDAVIAPRVNLVFQPNGQAYAAQCWFDAYSN